MENLKINVFEDTIKLDQVIVNIVVEDVPYDIKLSDMLLYIEKKLYELIGEDNAEELFLHDFNYDFWFDEEKERKNFSWDILLYSEDSKELIGELTKASQKEEIK